MGNPVYYGYICVPIYNQYTATKMKTYTDAKQVICIFRDNKVDTVLTHAYAHTDTNTGTDIMHTPHMHMHTHTHRHIYIYIYIYIYNSNIYGTDTLLQVYSAAQNCCLCKVEVTGGEIL